MAEVVVFLPGIMGSELYLGDELIWPGTPAEMLLQVSGFIIPLQAGQGPDV